MSKSKRHGNPTREELNVEKLEDCDRYPSPIQTPKKTFVDEKERISFLTDVREIASVLERGEELPSFEKAGQREGIFADPKQVTCGIVTCGGLCPGLNEVIRSVTLSSIFSFGVKRVLGFRYGYKGITHKGLEPLELTPEVVENIHGLPGTMLGSSRGPQDTKEMVDVLQKYGVNILFTLGGDGTLRGASGIAEEAKRRGARIAVVGIPKTIDNDIKLTRMSFGFRTAVEVAETAIHAAHGEALGAENGIGLIKLMGRHSGFISVHATLASMVANFCLIPESPFILEGENGLLVSIKRRLEKRKHAVIVVSEGAGQYLFESSEDMGRDASGNVCFSDIGLYLKDKITKYLKKERMESTLKYIDPSYTIRSAPANSLDSEYCLLLGKFAVHAGMAGRTNVAIGFWNGAYVHVPIPIMVRERNIVDINGVPWQAVVSITGQPIMMA